MGLDPRFSALLLEGRLDAARFAAIRDAACASWGLSPEALADPRHRRGVEDIVFRRHDNVVRFVLPWLARLVPDRAARVLDFGCGSGASTVALAHLFGAVAGLDILDRDVEAARLRARLLDCPGCEFHAAPPDRIVDAAIALRPDIVVMCAVVEHLTEAEKLSTLRRLWDALPPGGLLAVVETPNRYAWTDGHTFELPFFHLLPDEIALRCMHRSARPGFADHLRATHAAGGWPAFSEARHRAGLGVGYHDFEAALEEDLAEILVGDGFDAEIIGFFPVGLDDQLLLTYFDRAEVPAPAAFARSVLSLAFRKPRDQAERAANRAANAARSRQTIETHALGTTPRPPARRGLRGWLGRRVLGSGFAPPEPTPPRA